MRPQVRLAAVPPVVSGSLDVVSAAVRRLANRVLLQRSSLVLAALLIVLSLASNASARVETESPYTRLQTFNGALRYLRVDLGLEVLERDFDAGYLLFNYVAIEGQTPSRGAIEVIEVQDEVKVVVQLPEEPSHHETLLSDGLMRKLEQEYGDPPPKDATGDDDDADKGKNDADEGNDADKDNDDADKGNDDGSGPPASKKTRRKLKRRRSR